MDNNYKNNESQNGFNAMDENARTDVSSDVSGLGVDNEIPGLSEDSPVQNFDDEVEMSDFSTADHSTGLGRKDVKGRRICNVSCFAGGALGIAAIAACTGIVCALYQAGTLPTYAVGFPNGAIVGDVSTSVDDDGRTHIDVNISKPERPDDTSSSSSVTDDGNSSVSEPVSSDSTSTPGGDSSVDKPDSSTSASDTDSSSQSKPVVMPDTGEESSERVTALMESEFLRAQFRRVANGEDRYLASDLTVNCSGHTLSDISDAYGFSEDFIASYNALEWNTVPDVLRLPRL